MIEIDRRTGALGIVRVFQRKSDGARLYCIGASLQTMTDTDGVSLFGYVHAAKLLLRTANDVLLIGGAGGSLATMLARRGKSVTVVDIDPVAEQLARAHFQLDPHVEWVNADALDFIKRGARQFDAVFIDACGERGLVPQFTELDVLRQVWSLVRDNGAMLLNLVADDGHPGWESSLAEKLGALDAHVTLFRPEDGWEGNELVLVCNEVSPRDIDLSDICQRPVEVRSYLISLRAVGPIHWP